MATISLSRLDFSSITWITPTAPPPRRKAGEIESKRSDLPCPRVIRDIVEYKSTVDGSMITSRSQHRDHLKRHGMIELGNERVDVKGKRAERTKAFKASLRDDMQKAVQLYKQGFRNKPVGSANGIDVPGAASPVRISPSTPV